MVYMTLFVFLRFYIAIFTFLGIFGPKIPGFGPKMHISVMAMSKNTVMLSNICFQLNYFLFCMVIGDLSHFALFDPYWGIAPFGALSIKISK